MKLMKLDLPKLGYMRVLLLCGLVLLAAVGCGGQGEDDGATAGTAIPAPAGAEATLDANACHLLTHEEVSTLVEDEIVMRDQIEAGETWSTCQWENDGGTPLFTLTVYWTNGKQEWEAWRMAQGLGNEILEQAEGASADDVVQQGPVAGIGDAAYFSELLPSLVLKGDTLFEMNLFFVPGAESKFAGLARQLVAAIE